MSAPLDAYKQACLEFPKRRDEEPSAYIRRIAAIVEAREHPPEQRELMPGERVVGEDDAVEDPTWKPAQ